MKSSFCLPGSPVWPVAPNALNALNPAWDTRMLPHPADCFEPGQGNHTCQTKKYRFFDATVCLRKNIPLELQQRHTFLLFLTVACIIGALATGAENGNPAALLLFICKHVMSHVLCLEQHESFYTSGIVCASRTFVRQTKF